MSIVLPRRGFLRALGLGTAGLLVDPGVALWTPGARTYVDLGAHRPITFESLDWMSRDALAILKSQFTISLPWRHPTWIRADGLYRLDVPHVERPS